MSQSLFTLLQSDIRFLHIPVPAFYCINLTVNLPLWKNTGLPCSTWATKLWVRLYLFTDSSVFVYSHTSREYPAMYLLVQACQHL